MIFPRPSLKRSPRTRTRKHTTSESVDMDIASPPSRNSSLAHRKTRPPPLQIIPELSENGLDNATRSPATARPTQSMRQSELRNSRITLSAYTFSIDDALLMFGDGGPCSPVLSVSSSTTDGTSSDDILITPRTSDDEDCILPLPCFRPQRISIRPLCITKMRTSVFQEDEAVPGYFEEQVIHAMTEGVRERSMEEAAVEADHDFYAREFESFISFCPTTPSPTLPARRDSLVIAAEFLPSVNEAVKTKPRGRSRHSKPLPLPPPVTPPLSSFPAIPALPLVQTTAQKSVVRRKRHTSTLPNYPPPPPAATRPLPRIEVPLDIDDGIFSGECLYISPQGLTSERNCEGKEHANIYSRPSSYTIVTGTCPRPLAIPEAPISGVYSEVTLPRSSTDSDAPRSSTDSTLSLTSSTFSDDPVSPLSIPGSPSEERLRSRWSTSTLGSLATEPPRANILLSPFINVFGSRPRRVPPPLPKMPSQVPKGKHGYMPSGKHVPRQDSRSSTSSTGSTSTSDSESRADSPRGLKKKPIPVAMFLRTT